MKQFLISLIILLFSSSFFGFQNPELQGKFVRISPMGPIAIIFNENGKVEVDFNNDGTIDVISSFSIDNDVISFEDSEGAACPNIGKYKFKKTEYYISFDLIEDECGGRIKQTMGFWTNPNFEEQLSELDKKIVDSSRPEDYLNRARIYMAIGKSQQAKSDLDVYLESNPKDARALVNRAGTKFPADMKGAVEDCKKALKIDPKNKNAYFLKGLALYELGEKEQACNDFHKAIELGFTVLKQAEGEKCKEFWEKISNLD
jgi:tetratricopeptide (TPR) repeat protein